MGEIATVVAGQRPSDGALQAGQRVGRNRPLAVLRVADRRVSRESEWLRSAGNFMARVVGKGVVAQISVVYCVSELP